MFSHNTNSCDCGIHQQANDGRVTEIVDDFDCQIKVDEIDGALVATCQCKVEMQKSQAEQYVIDGLKKVSQAINQQGGILGHAKASLEATSISKISVIDGYATCDEALLPTISVNVVIIAFNVNADYLAKLMKNVLEGLVTRGQNR